VQCLARSEEPRGRIVELVVTRGHPGENAEPSQGMDVAQPTHVVLQVRGQRPAGPVRVKVTFGGGVDDAACQALALLLHEARTPVEKLFEGGRVAGHQSRGEDRRCRVEIAPRALQGLLRAAGRVPHLEPRVPEWVEHPAQRRCGDVGARSEHEEEIDVGVWRELAPSVAPYRHHGDAGRAAERVARQSGDCLVDRGRAPLRGLGTVGQPDLFRFA
jgi:hypothetical protein